MKDLWADSSEALFGTEFPIRDFGDFCGPFFAVIRADVSKEQSGWVKLFITFTHPEAVKHTVFL